MVSRALRGYVRSGRGGVWGMTEDEWLIMSAARLPLSTAASML